MNEVTKFMYYMFNKWCIQESKLLFGENLGGHVWEKYKRMLSHSGDRLLFYAELDKDCQQRLVNRANELYQ